MLKLKRPHKRPYSGLRLSKFLALIAGICASISVGAIDAHADFKDDIGYTQLAATLAKFGIAVPNGSGVPISIVEAGGANNLNYWPNTGSNDFGASTDPLSTAVVFIDGSNQPGHVVSSHATGQSRNFFGNTSSISPAANQVTVYEAGLFLNNVLHAPSGGVPETQNFRVQNFSWIGSFDTTSNTPSTPQEIADDVSALRRFDFMINRDNVTAVVGLNNVATPLPTLLTQSYNSIAVGKTDGVHSTGLTNLAAYGPGRSKPDLVSPFTTSSAATSSTSSVATFLHSAVTGTDAANSEVIKALLMSGATKSEFPLWTRTASQPLDDTFGAGELNVYNSFLSTLGGRFAGSNAPETPVGSYGWDYQTINPGLGNELKYDFVIPEGSSSSEFSVLLTWNVDVTGSFNGQLLANMDLTLTDSTGQIVDQSLSTVDNVEHIYIGAGQAVSSLGAGTYTLTITTDTPHDFGLAWRMSTLADVASADFDNDGDVDGRDFVAWQRGFGKLVNASRADGDADGDGDVDEADLAVYHTQFTHPEIEDPPQVLSVFAVPEPATVLVAVGGFLALLLRRRVR